MDVGHAILVIAFHLLKRKTTYVDLGPDYFDRRNADAVRRSLVKRLQNLGQWSLWDRRRHFRRSGRPRVTSCISISSHWAAFGSPATACTGTAA
jgi:hypothetical protein